MLNEPQIKKKKKRQIKPNVVLNQWQHEKKPNLNQYQHKKETQNIFIGWH